MKAFVLAAGLGTRLRPLSNLLPKPAWPLFDAPLAAHALDHLSRAGVTEAIVNLHHLGDRLRRSLEPWIPPGMVVRWSPEDPIQGTGGGLRPWMEQLGSATFLLVNGDTFQDLDLRDLLGHHRRCGGWATLALRRMAAGLRGPIAIGPDSRIVRFLDAWAPGHDRGFECEFTGIHALEGSVLEHLPAGPCCINADVHRKLVASGHPLYGYVPSADRFWSDLGTPARYLDAHLRLLDSRNLPPLAPGRLVLEDCAAEGGGRLRAPSYCGPGARVEDGAVAGPGVVLGRDSVVAHGVRVRDVVLWPGGRIGYAGARREIVASSGERLKVA